MKMAKAKVERKTMSYEFNGDVLSIETSAGIVHSFDFGDVPEELDAEFMALGRKTKMANFAVNAKSEAERIEMIQTGFERLKDGEWEKEREGGGPTVSAEVEALAKIKGKPVAAIQKALQAYDKATRAAILANAKVVEEAAKIKAARESVTVDLGDMV